MSYDVGSKIVTDGLVFNFSDNSERHYTGPPIQNMATTIAASGSFSDTNIGYTAGTETVNIPTLGSMTVPYMDGYNANPSSYCCLQPFYFVVDNGFVACSGSTQYTYSIVYRTTSGYTHPNYMYRYEYTSGGSYVTEVGIHDDSKRVHLGDGWYWAWNTFTTQATTARLYLRSFYYQYNISDRHSIARVLVTPGDFTGLPPRLWPALGTTRSNTQVIVDPVQKNTITASGLTYANTGSISFNGSTGVLTLPNISAYDFAAEHTVEIWFRPTENDSSRRNLYDQAYGGYGTWTHEPDGTINYYYGDAGTNGSPYIGHTSSFTVAENEIACVCSTRNTSESRWYKNGVYYNNYPHSYGTLTTTTADIRIGLGYTGVYFNGNIYAVRIYNKALSPSEVLQNYNAYKGRFGM